MSAKFGSPENFESTLDFVRGSAGNQVLTGGESSTAAHGLGEGGGTADIYRRSGSDGLQRGKEEDGEGEEGNEASNSLNHIEDVCLGIGWREVGCWVCVEWDGTEEGTNEDGGPYMLLRNKSTRVLVACQVEQ